MKKKHVLLAAFAAAMLTPTVAWAQYPQITDEAKENYKKMMTEERKRSDEAWAKALPIVQKEAKEGRPYIPLGQSSMICHKRIYRHFLEQKEAVCIVLVVVAVK